MDRIYEIDEYLKYLSGEFRRKRKSQGKTLEDVGYDLKVSPSYIGKIERAELTNLSLYTYILLAKYYNIHIDTITHRARIAYENNLKKDENHNIPE